MNRILMLAGMAVFLAGCGSAVKLDNVPVEDKTGTAVIAGAGGTQRTGPGTGADSVGKSNVTPVDIGKSTQDAAALSGPRIVFFDYDSFAIKPEFQNVVETNARFIKSDKTRKVVIEGHTDERGGREYNLALGQKRSEAVRQALSLLGVSDTQLEAVSFGKEKPVALGSDEESLAKNRRAEISYR